MTPAERAEKICEKLGVHPLKTEIGIIAAQIAEAEREARAQERKEILGWQAKNVDAWIEVIKREQEASSRKTQSMAADIADNFILNDGDHATEVGDAIRAMKLCENFGS